PLPGPRDRDFHINAPKAAWHTCAAQRDLQCARGRASSHSVAGIMQGEGNSHQSERFSEDLVLDFNDGSFTFTRVVLLLFVCWFRLFRSCGIRWRTIGPVIIPRRKMGNRYAPEALPSLV